MSANLPLFWQFWVAGLTIISLIFLAILVARVYFPGSQHAEEEVVWDGDLVEGVSPPPSWWFWLIVSALFFSVIYMIFYPSLGNYNGLFDLTTAKRYTESKENIDNKYYKKLAKLDSLDSKSLQKNAQAMQLASNIFAQNCSACHGKNALGQNAFPNLTDENWQWGGANSQIIQTITNGRTGSMPAWKAILGDENVTKVAAYVKSIKTINAKKDKSHAEGKAKYQQFCIACHGANGKGNPALGGVDLTDNIWRFGGDLESIKHSIALGRSGIMPAQKDRLSTLQIKLLAAWLQKSSQPQK
ncbi:MAG: cytochrome-c oxidase, cbb3-type subunit III [Candidatus Thioglobus sp.]|nr:cytochrome-c oxidase, cbb3-type subunit III [Candidatus Thioglobus sp.]